MKMKQSVKDVVADMRKTTKRHREPGLVVIAKAAGGGTTTGALGSPTCLQKTQNLSVPNALIEGTQSVIMPLITLTSHYTLIQVASKVTTIT